MKSIYMAQFRTPIMRLCLLIVATLAGYDSLEAQSISGTTCVAAGSSYSYTYVGSVTSGTYTILNGINIATGLASGSFTSSGTTIIVRWTAGMTAGSISFYASGG